MEGGPPMFPAGFTCPQVLWILPLCIVFRVQDFHPLRSAFPCRSTILCSDYAVRTPKVLLPLVWPLPISLAATLRISVDFFSSAYLDVSVHRVSLHNAMNSRYGHRILLLRGFPIRKSVAQCLFAAYHSLSQLVASFVAS